MYPRALITDVRHLEHTGIQPRLADAVLKQWLVGQRRAGGDHDPVEAQALRLLRDTLDRILRTGIQIMLGVHHPWQTRRVLCHRWHVQEPADVRPAVADENTNPGLLLCHVPLRRIHHLLRAGPAGRRHDQPCRSSRAAGINDRLGDVLRLAERPDGKDPRTARLEWLEG